MLSLMLSKRVEMWSFVQPERPVPRKPTVGRRRYEAVQCCFFLTTLPTMRAAADLRESDRYNGLVQYKFQFIRMDSVSMSHYTNISAVVKSQAVQRL